jgi:hypothetical protein
LISTGSWSSSNQIHNRGKTIQRERERERESENMIYTIRKCKSYGYAGVDERQKQ